VLGFNSLSRLIVAFIFGLLALALSSCASNYDETADWKPEKLYAEAKEHLNGKLYEKAISLYEKLEGRAAGSILSQQAQIEKAYAQYKSGDAIMAVSTLDRFIKINPASPALDYAYYLKGLITFNDDLGWLGRFTGQDLSERDPKAAKDAFESFKIVAERFPNSKYAPDSLDRMRYIVNSLAEADVIVARFYYQRGAYLAAANRAQLVIRDYDRAPAVEEALYLLFKSYEKLGMVELSSDTARVFALNFPDSPMLQTGQRAKKERQWWQIWNK